MLDVAGSLRPAFACLALGLSLSAQQATQPSEQPLVRSPAKWLVDLARDHGHGLQGRPGPHDIQIVLTLMRAAARLEPNAPEPCRWQFDILEDVGQPETALAELHRYVQRDPTDITARLRWIGLTIRSLQTIEDRQRFVRERLSEADDQPLIAGDAHRRLAEIALTRSDRADARKHIQTALKLAPCNVAANQLAYQILTTPDDREDRVRSALRLIAANPMQISLIWQLANLLDGLSLHSQAQFWYAYALDVHRAANPGKDPPAGHLFDLAQSRAAAGDLEAALKDCAQAIALEPRHVRARLLMVHILRKLRRGELALAQIRAIAEHYRSLTDRVVKTRDVPLATEMAWFYALYDPQPDQAMRLAKIAMGRPDPSKDARRAYGFAAIAKNDLPEAERALKDLAATDQMAAVGLARVYLATKRAHHAAPILLQAARLRGSGVAYDEIAQMLQANGLTVPPVPDYPNIRKRLADFDRTPLEYYKKPGRFLKLAIRFVQPHLQPAEPWYVLFQLTNVGPFSITLGHQMMLSPQVLVSVTTSGDRVRQFARYLVVDLERTPVLRPGQSVRLIQTIDIGPLRDAMMTTPQAAQEVVIGGILDPVRSPKGEWTHRLGGLAAPVSKTMKRTADASESAVADLKAAMESGPPAQAIRAGAVLASLLAESQAKRNRQLGYEAMPIDGPSVSDAMIKAAMRRDRHPVIRARLIESFRDVKLTNPMIRKLSGGLSDKDWLARMMTVWLLAEKQGAVFETVARRTARSDPDPLVRDLAAAYVAKWQHRPGQSKPE